MKNDFKLSDLPKRNIHKVPDKYFDKLPAQIMERTSGAGYNPVTWYAAAWKPLRMALASLVLLLAVGVVYLTQFRDKSETQAIHLATVADDDIMDYLSTYAVLETGDFAELSVTSEQAMTADFLNVSASAAEEELEYYKIETTDF